MKTAIKFKSKLKGGHDEEWAIPLMVFLLQHSPRLISSIRSAIINLYI